MSVAPYIRAGRLRLRAELQYPATSSDGAGGYTTTWTKVKDVWIALRERSARERIEAMRLESSISHEIWARYDAALTPDRRIVLDGVAYNIRAVMNPEGRNAYVRLLVDSGVAT